MSTGLGSHSELRHSFTTRFLFSAISASLYDGDRSLDDLLDEFAQELIEAYENGICVA